MLCNINNIIEYVFFSIFKFNNILIWYIVNLLCNLNSEQVTQIIILKES